MSIWKKAHERTWGEIKALWSDYGEWGIVAILVSALAIGFLWFYGPPGTASDEIWFKIALTFAILVLTVIVYPVKFVSALSSLYREAEEELLRHKIASDPKAVRGMSFMRLREVAAEEFGWDFGHYSDQLLDLIGGVRQAALHVDRTGIVIEGRKDCATHDERMKLYFPLVPIPREHLADWWIEPPMFSNWEVKTYRPGKRDTGDCYRDLHLSDERAVRDWLRTRGDDFKTPAPNIELREAILYVAGNKENVALDEAVTAIVSAARSGELAIYGSMIVTGMGMTMGSSPIGRAYWQRASLNLRSFDFHDEHVGDESFQYDWQRTEHPEDIYCRLRTNREHVRELWPR
jgi:hypothetical protein